MIEVTQENCTGCGACQQICPIQCIEMKQDIEGFFVPKVNVDQCIKCNKCERICPEVNRLDGIKEGEVYAYKNSKSDIRTKSSSGGFFYASAEYFINKNGYVFGAVYNEQLEVVHDFTNKLEELHRMMGSKYVQSNLQDSYVKVKHFLNENYAVLFTGTPCQIAGLKAYLGKEYNNLFTIQLICHGVPSPLLFEKYKTYLKEKYHFETLRKFSFRDKTGFRICLGDNNKTKMLTGSIDLFLRPFLKGLNYRYCCYNCQYAHKHIADITIGDYWGADNILPEFYEEGGMSCVIINTEKGRRLFNEVTEEKEIKKSTYNDAAKKNSNLLQPTKLPKERKNFYMNIEQDNYIGKLRKYVPLKSRVAALLRLIILQTK